MSTDRELLDAAAKAAGLKVRHVFDDGSLDVGADRERWNPLADDGDALRLAVKLGLEIRPGTWTITAAGDGAWEEVSREGNNDYAATRRAIVRAAAEIGRAKG